MADGKDIGIHIKTTADTAGVEKADDSIKQLKRTTAADIDAMTDKVKTAQWGFYDLDAEIRKTAKSSETFTSGVTKMEKPTRDNANALMLFSQGFEDAQYGIRGVLNNIPQFVQSIGVPKAFAAAISLAAVAGTVLYDVLNKTEEKASDVAERMENIAKAIGDAEIDRFEEVGTAIQTAAQWADALDQKWGETKKAEGEYAKQALENADKLDKAQILIEQTLGRQVDKFKELEKIAEAEAKKRELTAQQAIANENQRRADADAAVAEAATALAAQEARQLDLAAELINLRAELKSLRDQRDEAEKAVRKGLNFPIGGQFGVTLSADVNDQYYAGQKQLKDQPFLQNLKTTQERVDRLEEAQRELVSGGGVIEQLEIGLAKAKTNAADVAKSVEIEIAGIVESAQFDEVLAKAETVTQKSELFAQELATAFGKIETNNAKGIAAKETIEKAAEDGRITAKETAAVAEATRTLIGQVQAGIATTSTTLQDLLRLQTAFVASQESMADRVKALEARINQINQRQ